MVGFFYARIFLLTAILSGGKFATKEPIPTRDSTIQPTPAPEKLNLDRPWQKGDKPPKHVRFVGFPSAGSFINVGDYSEDKVYEVDGFDGRGEAPFQVRDDTGFPFWVNKNAFRVVD